MKLRGWRRMCSKLQFSHLAGYEPWGGSNVCVVIEPWQFGSTGNWATETEPVDEFAVSGSMVPETTGGGITAAPIRGNWLLCSSILTKVGKLSPHHYSGSTFVLLAASTEAELASLEHSD